MTATLTGMLLGLLVGLKHAFEPDHLTAVSTLVTEAKDARRGALLGAIWGLGHTLTFVVVGGVLVIVGAHLPPRLAAGFECAVAVMLVLLGIRAMARGIAIPGTGTVPQHGDAARGRGDPGHGDHGAHFHVGTKVVMWRPLAVGLVHGLAGSGTLTTLALVDLPTNAQRVVYLAVFGLGTVAGMTIASGLAGAALRRVAQTGRVQRGLALATGALSIAFGVWWAVDNLPKLA